MNPPAERWLSPLDRRLLERLAVMPNVVRAARSLGIGRDRAVYRLGRLGRLFGGPLVLGRRGGAEPGGTVLTARGRRLLRVGDRRRRRTNRWSGTYRERPSPRVELAGGGRLDVAFRARDGARVSVELDEEALVVARHAVALSARNTLRTTIRDLRRRRDGTVLLLADWEGRAVRVALTPASVSRLGLRAGGPAYLYAKAVAVRRLTPGSLRS